MPEPVTSAVSESGRTIPPAEATQPGCPPLDLLFLAAPLPLSLSRRSDGRLLAVNDAWVRFTGIGREQALGQTTTNLGHWMNGDQRRRYLAALDAGESVFVLETYGESHQRVRLNTNTMVFGGEQLLLVSLEDVTGEFDAEQRLVEANRRLQQQVELHEATEKLASVGHWVNAEDDDRVIWSPGLFALTGREPNPRLIRSEARSVVHEDDMPAWLEARQALDGRLLEFRLRMPDGSIRWARSRMSRTTIQGNPETDFGVVQDVTAEKLAQEALAAQANFIRNIAARVPGMFYMARIRPDGCSEIPYVNDAVREMLELEPEALRHDARPLFQRVHPDDLPGVKAALAASARDLVPWRQLYRAVLPVRGVRWFNVEAVPEREPDGSVVWHGFTTDVTEAQETARVLNSQHRMLEAIRQAQASYIDAGDRSQAFERLLSAMLELTSSEFGFVGEVMTDEAGQACLTIDALNCVGWDGNSLARQKEWLASGPQVRQPDSLVGQVLAKGQPVLVNDMVHASGAVGLPLEHPRVRTFLGASVFVGDRLVAMVGLANRAAGYAASDVAFLQPLLATLGQLGLAFRARLDRLRFREALQETTQELMAKSRDLQATLDAMNQGLAMVDGQGRYRLFNRRMLEMLNLPERFMASHPTHAEVSQLQIERGDFGPGLSLIDPALRAYMGRDPAEQPEQYLRRTLDGRVLEVRTRHRLDGGMVRTYSDVTSYVNGQEQLKEERQRLAWVLEATRPGIWELDVVSGGLVINDRWAEMIGHDVESLRPLGFETWRSRIHPHDLEGVMQVLEHHLAGETDYYECDLRMRHAQGHWVWINTRGRVHRRDDQGRPLYMSGTHIDISERVLAQEEVRALNATLEERVRDRTAALERSMRDMETISYSIAHDLRAPLRAVNGFASLIADQGEELAPVTRDMFLRISRASRNMGQMITDMLELLRVVRVELSTVPVDLEQVARRAADALAPGMAQKDLVCGRMPRAMGDATLLRQVLSNLLDNAIKYARPGERPSVELGFDESQGAYFLKDRGVGFDMSRADKLFGLFQRLHLASDVPGTGVGLAIVSRIIERHGGRVWAWSAPGEGTTFWWTLPRA